MNLNEECLLNYLTNPDELNKLSVLLGDFCINKEVLNEKELLFQQTIEA